MIQGMQLAPNGAQNADWFEALRAARRFGCVHGGWISVPPQTPERRILDGRPATEEQFMEHFGYSDSWKFWEKAVPDPDQLELHPNWKPWHSALHELGLPNPLGVIDHVGDGQTRYSPKAKARELLVHAIGRSIADGRQYMPDEVAAEWADAFLAPVHDSATPLFSGTADTATLNTGVVFLLGDPDSVDCSVGCLWCGDED